VGVAEGLDCVLSALSKVRDIGGEVAISSAGSASSWPRSGGSDGVLEGLSRLVSTAPGGSGSSETELETLSRTGSCTSSANASAISRAL
jgi:hypothetical protein